MTTDIAIPTSSGTVDLAGFGAPSAAMERLARWVEAAGNAHRLVAPLVGTPFVPDAYKPKIDPRATDKEKAEAREIAVANATAAVLQGLSLGLDPMISLQQIYVVHGRPGMYARIKVALVTAAGHEVWTEDLSDVRAVVAGRRKGRQQIERITITMDQARRAGWTRNETYAKTPQDMLWARAAGRVCDRIASDVLMGIASVEEIQDEIAISTGAGTRTVTAPKRVKATTAALPAAPEPPLEEEQPVPTAAPMPEPQPEPQPEAAPGITQAQQRKLHALLKEAGLGNRVDGLARISTILGWEVGSTKDLSKRDAATIIDALETPAEPEPEVEAELIGETVEVLGDTAEPELWPDVTPAGGAA